MLALREATPGATRAPAPPLALLPPAPPHRQHLLSQAPSLNLVLCIYMQTPASLRIMCSIYSTRCEPLAASALVRASMYLWAAAISLVVEQADRRYIICMYTLIYQINAIQHCRTLRSKRTCYNGITSCSFNRTTCMHGRINRLVISIVDCRARPR